MLKIQCSPFYAMYGRHFRLDIPQIQKDSSADNPLSYGMTLGTQLSRVHKLVKLCADETVARYDSKVKPVKPESLQIGDNVLIYRPISTQKDAKFDWINGFVIVDFNDFSARIKDEKTDKLDWVHRRHIRKVKVRPPHLDSDDESESEDLSRDNKNGLKNKSDFSSTGGGDPIVVPLVKNEPAVNSDIKVDSKTGKSPEAAPKVKPPKKTQSAAKGQNTAVPYRRSGRSSKPVDRLNISTNKGASYADK